jgi:hypothetical protein
LFDKKGNHKLMPDILKDLSDVYKVIKWNVIIVALN